MRARCLPWIHVIGAGLMLIGLMGCAGLSGHGASGPETAKASSAAVALRRGMLPDEVRQLLGEPGRVQAVLVGQENAEQWIYVRGQKTEIRQVVAGTREMPYYDPILKEMKTIPEPVYADEATTITEELLLVWQSGVLVEWRTEYRRGKRAYTR